MIEIKFVRTLKDIKPYAKFIYGNNIYQTKILSNYVKNPKWNEEITWDIS